MCRCLWHIPGRPKGVWGQPPPKHPRQKISPTDIHKAWQRGGGPASTERGTDVRPQFSQDMHIGYRRRQAPSPLSLALYSFACGLFFPVSTSSIQFGHALHRWNRPLSQETPARTHELWLCQRRLGEMAKSPHCSFGNPIRDVFLYFLSLSTTMTLKAPAKQISL